MPRPRSRLYRRSISPYYYCEYTTPDGRVRQQSTRCRDPGAAEAWRAAREIERTSAERLAALGVPTVRAITFEDACSTYLAEKEKEWSDGWYGAVETLFTHQAVPFFGPETQLAAITKTRVAEFRAAQIKRPRMPRREVEDGQAPPPPVPVRDATVNRTLAALATLGSWAKGRGYLGENVFAKPPREEQARWYLDEEQRPVPKATSDQLERFLSALPDRWRLPYTVSLDTGLRHSEVERLRWEWLDLKVGIGVIPKTKARKRMREFILPPRSVALLSGMTRRLDGKVFGALGDSRRAFATAARTAGLGHLWVHALRHFWATAHVAAGADLVALMAGGGWSSLRMVQRYATANVERLRASAARIEAERTLSTVRGVSDAGS